MPADIQTLKNELKQKDREIKELKQMLAEAESELREYSSSDNLVRPRASILESRTLNRAIKGTFYFLLCAIIVLAGLYPWLFKDKIFGTQPEPNAENSENVTDETTTPSAEPATSMVDAGTPATTTPTTQEPARDIFQPEKKMVEVASDLGWLNVRTEPNVETGKIIKKLNSGEEYEWLEKKDNWYKLIIDSEDHTGYAAGEYLTEK